MNKVINTVVALFGLSTLGFAGETAKAPVVTPQVTESLDFKVKVFAAGVIADLSDVSDFDSYAIGGGIALEVPILVDNLSVELGGSIFEDEVYAVQSNVLYSLPLGDSFSVYGIGGGAYDFESEQWTVGAGAGVNYAFNEQFSVFADGIYNFLVENDAEDGAVTIRLGVGFKF